MTFPQPTHVTTNGVSLEVFDAGGNGRPLVLCHGWPEHAYSWRHQIEPLLGAGYRVIVPNQRGYGHSSRPPAVEDYAIEHLTGDLCGLLDHYGYDDAVFVGHDWGAIVVWNMGLMHPERVQGIVNLSVPFMERGPSEWIGFWEKMLGGDFYIVHFNRQPGVADAVFEQHTRHFLRNMYRTNQWQHEPPELEGMAMIAVAQADTMPGEPLMSEEELDVFVNAFDHSGFTGGINWYRNFTRNWHAIGEYEQHIHQPTLMLYGAYDMVPAAPNLGDFVTDLRVETLPCGHWIQQEQPTETNRIMLEWLGERFPA